jgi:60 kDa SS-A/Ro ribonucleoprotein
MTYHNYGPRANKPQTEQALPEQVKNNAGGYVFALNDFGILERFLILGTTGGTYYAGERNLTKENLDVVDRCMAEDPLRTVRMAASVLENGRAYKRSAALVVLAKVASHRINDPSFGGVRRAALEATHNLYATDFFEFLGYVQEYRGWGKTMRKVVGDWYASRDDQDIMYQMVKYRNRQDWTHRDVLRLAHVQPGTPYRSALYNWAVNGWDNEKHGGLVGSLVWAFESLKTATTPEFVAAAVREHRMTWEMVPDRWMNDKLVLEALLEGMPPWALIRNLGRMTAAGVFTKDQNLELAIRKISSEKILQEARVHPLRLYVGLRGYTTGQGRSGAKWNPLKHIEAALEDGFYRSFKAVVPSGKIRHIALDVSGSMWGGTVCGIEGFSPAQASVLIALVVAKTEEKCIISAFDTQFKQLDLDARDTLESAMNKIRTNGFGATDVSVPFQWGINTRTYFDSVEVLTDSETYAGTKHPYQTLDSYRSQINPNTRQLVVGMVSNGFTVARPDDALSLDVVGMATDTPSLMTEFVAGRV